MACDLGFKLAFDQRSCEGTVKWEARCGRSNLWPLRNHFHSHLFQCSKSLLAVLGDAWRFSHVQCGLEAFGLHVKTWANSKWRLVIYSWCECVIPMTSVHVSIQMWMNARTPDCAREASAPTASAPIAAPAPPVWSWWMGRPAEV